MIKHFKFAVFAESYIFAKMKSSGLVQLKDECSESDKCIPSWWCAFIKICVVNHNYTFKLQSLEMCNVHAKLLIGSILILIVARKFMLFLLCKSLLKKHAKQFEISELHEQFTTYWKKKLKMIKLGLRLPFWKEQRIVYKTNFYCQ